jgi:hypothetical protein
MHTLMRNSIRYLLRAAEYAAVNAANVDRPAPPQCKRYSSSDLLVARELADRLQPGDAVLDIGCSDGHRLGTIQFFKPIGKTGVDLAPPPSPFGMSLSAYDGRRLPFEDKTFDVAMICYVLHHLKKEHAVSIVEEAIRVSRRGVLIVEDSLPQFGVFYRLRNTFHRLDSNVAFSPAPNYIRTPDNAMFLTHKEWSSLFGRLPDVAKVEVHPLSTITKYAHHTLFELRL